MSYIYERDGLAACPDDFSRTGDAPELSLAEEKYYDSQVILHQEELKDELLDLAAQKRESVMLDLIEYTQDSFAEYLRDVLEPEQFLLLIKAIFDDNSRVQAEEFVTQKLKSLSESAARSLAANDVHWS
jgi:hypothetical protein